MSDKQFRGVYAALLTPRLEDGSLDLQAFRSLLKWLGDRNMRRFAVNGATGEFCLTTPDQLQQLLAVVREVCGDSAEILCGVGAAGLAGVQALTRVAEDAGVQGLLLPMPYFFPYSQDDLTAFCIAVAAATRLPILLYNLPQFTSGLESATVCDLVRRVTNLVGVKDSSGSLEIVSALTEQVPDACRIVGNDSALAAALRGGVCDGVVSGVACALPEVISALYEAAPASPQFAEHSAMLDAFIEQLNPFPTPWGLKWAAEERGVLQARFAQPVSTEREQAAKAFRTWLRDWLPSTPASL